MADELDLEQFREIFISEAKENLQILNQSLVALEQNPKDKETINSIFRVAHTLKGMAATMGFEKITQLSHHMEDVLEKIRKGEVQATAKTADVLFNCLDVLEKLVGGVETSDKNELINLAPLIKKLDAIVEEGIADETDEPAPEASAQNRAAVPADSASPALPPNRTANDASASVLTAPKPKAAAVSSVSAETIRVNVTHLDVLMNLVGEMVINKGRLEEVSERHKIPELAETLSLFDRIAADLQTAVLKTRMVQVSHIFDRYPRMVRDLAKKLGKEIHLEIAGADIEVDRMLLEQINEPLVHLLRNSIDHGIESKEERLNSKKEPAGKILLCARREQSAVVIEVRDDGKGMSAERLKQIAIEKGILTPESAEKMSERDAFFLICDPRFSTAKEITDISGRGVGMDVVKSTVEAVNGSIQIDSVKGSGSTFALRLPLSLAIIRVLLVQVRGESYAIPLSNIAEIVSIQEGQIKTVDQKEVVVLRNSVLPLVRLDQRLVSKSASQKSGQSETEHSKLVKVVVIELAEKRVGFVVSDLMGRREVVVKTLSGICKQAKGFSGATILGDGRVVLILDVGAWI